MALADLIAALQAEVEDKAAEQTRTAQREAERIRRKAQEQSLRRREELLRARESALRRERAREIAESEAAIRRRLLDARQQALEQIFAAARAELPALQLEPKYLQALQAELQDALSYVGDEDVVVRCARDLVPYFEKMRDGRRGQKVELGDELLAGFRVVAEQGTVEVDKTLDSRLQRLEPRLRIELARQLETAAEEGMGACAGKI